MLGFYDNFPENVHWKEVFNCSLPYKRLQLRLAKTLYEINISEFKFDEITCPTIPECSINFEIGIAEDRSFNYIDSNELQRTLNLANKENITSIDLFWAIRYYRNTENKRNPLKFDYYLMRLSFDNKIVEFQVLHERGPRYISPEDLTAFLIKRINLMSQKRILKPFETT